MRPPPAGSVALASSSRAVSTKDSFASKKVKAPLVYHAAASAAPFRIASSSLSAQWTKVKNATWSLTNSPTGSQSLIASR